MEALLCGSVRRVLKVHCCNYHTVFCVDKVKKFVKITKYGARNAVLVKGCTALLTMNVTNLSKIKVNSSFCQLGRCTFLQLPSR